MIRIIAEEPNQAGNFGIFLYGALERLLIPTGLHHLVYTPFLYTNLGGTAEVAGQVFEGCRNILLCRNGRSERSDVIRFCCMGCKRTFQDVRSGGRMSGYVPYCKTGEPYKDQGNPDPGGIYLLYRRRNRAHRVLFPVYSAYPVCSARCIKRFGYGCI